MTKRAPIVRATVIIVSVITLYLAYHAAKRTLIKAEFSKSILSESFIKLSAVPDSTPFYFHDVPYLLLVYFNSSCLYCQEEFDEIEKNKNKFKDIEVIFFSSESISQINAFAKQYSFEKQSNFHFAKINPDHQDSIFGPLMMPTFFVYKKSKLIREIKGKREIEEILKSFL